MGKRPYFNSGYYPSLYKLKTENIRCTTLTKFGLVFLFIMDPMEENVFLEEHMKLTFGVMNDLRKRKELCDVVLHVGELDIHAHKVVLASFSPYFYAMFTNDLVESRQNSITLKSMDPRSVELLIEFAYTAQIKISEQNVQYVLPVASILQICQVRKACCDFLQSQLDPSNCIGIKDFADIYGCIDLAKAAEKFMFRHFLEVSESEEFENLSKDQLIDFISRDELFVKSEDEVRFQYTEGGYFQMVNYTGWLCPKKVPFSDCTVGIFFSININNIFLRDGGIGPMPNPQFGGPGFSVRVSFS